MNFGGVPFAESTMAGVGFAGLAGAPVEPPIEVIIDPFTVEISGVANKPLVDSLSVDIELGRQGTAAFMLINANVIPQIGEPVRILFYDEVLFVGQIDNLEMQSNNPQTYKTYKIECTDHSYLLFRTIVKREFVNVTLSSLANSLLTDELSGNGITLGTVDNFTTIPSVSGDKVSAFDLLNGAAIAVGVVFYIDNDKKLQFRGATVDPAPMVIDESIVEDATLKLDRETYRNVQTVIATGTATVQGTTPVTIEYTTADSGQILQRAQIEGNNGEYKGIDSITHPTSNDPVVVTRLAVAYGKILLAVRGALRETLSVRTRQYGFRVGQSAEVSIPHLGRDSAYVVQNISMQEVAGKWLLTSMDLTPDSLRRRAQQLWLEVVSKGTVVVLPPTVITSHVQEYTTPGTYTFTVPVGATVVQLTARAGGSGGGGGAYSRLFSTIRFVSGGSGGAGGKCITVIDAVPGENLTIVVGAGGARGLTVQQLDNGVTAAGTNGSLGGQSYVSRTGGQICLAYPGGVGLGGQVNAATGLSFTPPGATAGGGLFGQSITQGSGGYGGPAGNGSPFQHGQAGGDGSVTVEW